MRRLLIQLLPLVAILFTTACDCICSPKGTTLTGVVKCDGKAISGVAVTDGEQIVYTNDRGVYNITSTKPYGLVYITTPSGYEPQMKDSVRPAFWAKTMEAANVKERHDFELKKVDDSTFSVLMFSDTHFCNDPKREDVKYFKELAMPAINRAAQDAGGNLFAVNLGDVTWDRFWYATGLSIESVPQHLADNGFPMPFYCVNGNHDYDPAVHATDNPNVNAIKRYMDTFGPTFYSMNRGGVHFVMLDNIVYKNEVKENQKTAKGVVGSRNYDLYVDDAQMAWLTKDLQAVDKSTPLVICMHAPLFTINNDGEQVYGFADGKSEALVELVKGFDSVKFFSGHSHRTVSYVHPEYPNIVEYNVTSIGGDLWTTLDKCGLNIGEDGADAGFYLCTFKNGKFSKRWYSVERGSEYPFRAYDMNEVSKVYKESKELQYLCKLQKNQVDYSKPKYKNYIYVNCWAWEDGCTLTATENGKPLKVEKTLDSDPLAAKVVFAKPKIFETKKENKKINIHSRAINMFRFKASSATTPVEITLTTPDGHTYTQIFNRPTALLEK
jgi:3',5'-cyclic AMP phosphodiesterase CpdA